MRPQPPFRHHIELPLRDASSGTHKLLIALCVGIPLLTTLGVMASRSATLAATLPAWWPAPGAGGIGLAVTVLGSVTLAWFLLRAMQRNRVHIDAGAMVIQTSFYRQRVALGDLDLAAARVLSLDEHREWRPLLKTNGFSLPGYHSGHFRLRNRKKAFCTVAGAGRIAMIPRHDGSVLLLGFRQPEQALAQLREACGHA